MYKKKHKLLIFFCFTILFLMVLGCNVIWRSPSYYLVETSCDEDNKILGMEQYDSLSKIHKRPFKIKTKNVFVYGSEHTKNPNNSQIADIEKEWENFNPSVLLVEGRLGFFIPVFMDPVKKFGEMGKAVSLAKKDNIKVYSWELPKEALLRKLTNNHSSRRLALFEILRPYFGNYRFGVDNPNKFVLNYIERAQWFGLQQEIKSVADIDELWNKDFPEIDWRKTSDQYGLPGYMQLIADDSNYYRNQHLVCNIEELMTKGERVFVVCGSSHAVCIENSFKN